MQGFKSAILAIFHRELGWPCSTMTKKLPKTFSVLKVRINLLNFNLKNISQNVKNIIFVYFCLFLLKISKYLLNSLNI